MLYLSVWIRLASMAYRSYREAHPVRNCLDCHKEFAVNTRSDYRCSRCLEKLEVDRTEQARVAEIIRRGEEKKRAFNAIVDQAVTNAQARLAKEKAEKALEIQARRIADSCVRCNAYCGGGGVVQDDGRLFCVECDFTLHDPVILESF